MPLEDAGVETSQRLDKASHMAGWQLSILAKKGLLGSYATGHVCKS